MTSNLIDPTSITDGDIVLHHYLDHLAQDPSWETVVEAIGSFVNIRDAAQWMIGDVLVFIRERINFNPIDIFDWDGDEIPEAVIKVVYDRYGCRIDSGQGVDWLCWHTIRFDDFWLLCRPGEIRLWEKNQDEFSEVQFSQYLEQIETRLRVELGSKNLYKYYRTSFCFTRTHRWPHSWTWHYETTNLAAGEIRDGLLGQERLKSISVRALNLAEELEGNGHDTVGHVKGMIQTQNDNDRG